MIPGCLKIYVADSTWWGQGFDDDDNDDLDTSK